MKEEPMDIAVGVWRYLNDPEYRKLSNRLFDLGNSHAKAGALRLLELCEGSDPSDFYREIEEFRPSSYVIAELVMLAKKNQAKAAGRQGAVARHSENRAIKQDVFAWLDEHFSAQKSMDAAAAAIAGKIAPVVFRTARAWVTEWKKLRSAGTA